MTVKVWGSVSAGGRYDQEHVFSGLNWGEEVVDKLSVSTSFITMTDRIFYTTFGALSSEAPVISIAEVVRV